MYKKYAAFSHAKKLGICFGALLPLTLGAMETKTVNVADGARSTLHLHNLNELNTIVHDSAYQKIGITTMNGSVHIKQLTNNSSIYLNWWYGKPPTVTVENMGESATVYNGVSNFKYYASCSAALGVGAIVGVCGLIFYVSKLP